MLMTPLYFIKEVDKKKKRILLLPLQDTSTKEVMPTFSFRIDTYAIKSILTLLAENNLLMFCSYLFTYKMTEKAYKNFIQ